MSDVEQINKVDAESCKRLLDLCIKKHGVFPVFYKLLSLDLHLDTEKARGEAERLC